MHEETPMAVVFTCTY